MSQFDTDLSEEDKRALGILPADVPPAPAPAPTPTGAAAAPAMAPVPANAPILDPKNQKAFTDNAMAPKIAPPSASPVAPSMANPPAPAGGPVAAAISPQDKFHAD